MTMPTYLESKFFGGYQVPHKSMLHPISAKQYYGFYQYRDEIENFLLEQLKSHSINFSTFPNTCPMLEIEKDDDPIFIPNLPKEEPSCIDETNGEPFFIGKISSHYPLNKREKPNGIIFEDDWSFLQFEQIVAWSLIDQKMYLISYSYHYGRIKDTQEQYFFRYDKESDYEYVVENENKKYVRPVDYKPMTHFHGNSDDPHFPDPPKGIYEQIEELIGLLKINLPRLKIKYGECDVSLP